MVPLALDHALLVNLTTSTLKRLRGDAFVAAREVGFYNLCEIIDERPFGIDTLINHRG